MTNESRQEAPAKRTGRPPKAAADKRGHVVAVRLSDEEVAILEALVVEQRARGSSVGLVVDVGAADVIRGLLLAAPRLGGPRTAAPPAPPEPRMTTPPPVPALETPGPAKKPRPKPSAAKRGRAAR